MDKSALRNAVDALKNIKIGEIINVKVDSGRTKLTIKEAFSAFISDLDTNLELPGFRMHVRLMNTGLGRSESGTGSVASKDVVDCAMTVLGTNFQLVLDTAKAHMD